MGDFGEAYAGIRKVVGEQRAFWSVKVEVTHHHNGTTRVVWSVYLAKGELGVWLDAPTVPEMIEQARKWWAGEPVQSAVEDVGDCDVKSEEPAPPRAPESGEEPPQF